MQLTDLVSRSRSKRGSALLIILGFVTLLTVLVVSLLLTTRFERSASSLALGRGQADVLADYAGDVAIGRLREAIDEGRQFNASYYTTWASEPGRIHVFTIDQSNGGITRAPRDMFSAPPGPDADSANVDLNKTGFSGLRPITGTAPGTMKVGWINVLADPSQPASASNRAVGRIAYWVDDESCKVNINTADGSRKVVYNSDGSVKTGDITQSFGFGTPSEISLGAFGLSNQVGAAVAAFAAGKGFNSLSEVTRVTGVSETFYPDNKFSLTFTSRSPDLNMFGEPKIYLFPVQAVSNVPQNLMAGGYGNYATALAGSATASVLNSINGPIDFIYPITPFAPTMTATINGRNQLPTMPTSLTRSAAILPLAQCLTSWSSNGAQGTNFNSGLTNYPLGVRIARYLQGYNSQNQPLAWPHFGDSTVSGFAGKYSIRQLNSIALQVLEIASGKNVMTDQSRLFTQPGYMVRGFLPDPGSDPTNPGAADPPSLVYGLGRAPKATEMRFIVSTLAPSNLFGDGNLVPALQIQVAMETYLPKYYAGVPLDYDLSSISDFQFDSDGNVHIPHGFNQQDRPIWTNGNSGSTPPVPPTSMENNPPSALNTLWMEEMLRIGDQSNTDAGVDLVGWPAQVDVLSDPNNAASKKVSISSKDPAQSRAATYHDPFCKIPAQSLPSPPYDPNTPDPNAGFYKGSEITSKVRAFLLGMQGPSGSLTWSPGTYHVSPNQYLNSIRVSKVGVTRFTFSGGVALWTRTGSGAGNFWEVFPLDSMRGQYTGENVSGMVPSNLREYVKKAVVPVEFSVDVPGTTTYSLQVADPLVNKFPGDWEPIVDPQSSKVTLLGPTVNGNGTISTAVRGYRRNGGGEDPDFPRSANPESSTYSLPGNFNGDNVGYRPGGGGDPLSVWLPRQDIRYPKQSRFPSIGALNFIRTGMIPDDTSADLKTQHGTPWRSLSFNSTSAGQATARGRYPDWAMLDLFTVPFLPQLPYLVDTSGSPIGTVPAIRKLTSGGSTEGRLNINNPAVPFPFSETYPGVTQSPPQRTLPLQALFYGIAPSNSYDASDNPVYSVVDQAMLAAGVQSYLALNGPFMLPGQLAEVPAVAGYTYSGVAANARSRNDLMKNIIGATTTQSNTFSIWVVSQTFKKSSKNSDYSRFEPGDTITGEARKHYIVERLIETGKDGVPGNAAALTPSTTNDGILGTADDPLDSQFHPAMTYPLPYRWRVALCEDVAL